MMAKRPKKMQPKPHPGGRRPIDRKRDAAVGIEVNPPDDDSPIIEFLTLDEKLYVLKERGLYRVMLADEIDPERKNIEIPNTVQRALRMGADSEIVGRTLLTGKALFKSEFLPNEIDCNRAMTLLLEITRDLVAMSITAAELSEKEDGTFAASNVSRRKDGTSSS